MAKELNGVFKTVSYGKTFNDGNYESTRIDVTFELAPGDDETEIYDECRSK